MKMVAPITPQQQQLVVAEVQRYISSAADFFAQAIPQIPILFDLSGRAAGMYKINAGSRVLRFNPYLFAKYFHENLEDTVPHEVAHYVTDLLHGIKTIRPHGKEWQQVMRLFGVPPRATHRFDMQGIPQRQQRRFHYRCACNSYQLTTRRHNMISRGERRYLCRNCHSELQLAES